MALQNYSIQKMKVYLGGIYEIPNYQREYSWEEQEIEDFWDDLFHVKNSEEKTDHFFGQIVIHNDEENQKHYIIDGQQRTITSMS